MTDLLEKLAAAGLRFSDLLLRGQTFRLRVAGRSMSPALWNGDQITVEPASPASLQEGDVILFHQCGQLICHRVVAIQDSGAGRRLITKGDAETGCREVIQPDQVLGRVVAVTRRWLWAGSLSKRTDGWLARLRDEVAPGLLALQGLRSYRRIMRALLSRCFAYQVVIPEGRRRFRYHRMDGRRLSGALVGQHRFHLVAKLAGISLGSVYVEAGAKGFWLQGLYVRVRYRGLGVGSQLIALAATAVSRNRPPVLLVSVEPTNTAALNLFAKTGFRETGDLRGSEVSLRQEL